MATAVNMPQIGQDITKGVIREWFINEGDPVEEGAILATVESEKAAFEVEAMNSGTLIKILYRAGEEAAVFKPIAYIGEPGEKVPDIQDDNPSAAEETHIEAEIVKPSPNTAGSRKIFASPAVKRLAREHNLSLADIKGSGPEGRIIKRDLLPYLAGVSEQTENAPGPVVDKVIPFSPARQRMSRRLTESKKRIPHFYLTRQIDVSAMLAGRKKYNDEHRDKVSINDMILYSVARSLREFPRLNAHVEDHQVILKGNINIGMAVIAEDGILVPVIPDTDRKSLGEISRYTKEMIEKAQQGIMPGSAPGTITISNLGMYGISEFQAIINPPESAILTVGNAEKRAVPGDQGVRFADYMAFGLACDHRAIDGAYGARFLESLAQKLENFKI